MPERLEESPAHRTLLIQGSSTPVDTFDFRNFGLRKMVVPLAGRVISAAEGIPNPQTSPDTGLTEQDSEA